MEFVEELLMVVERRQTRAKEVKKEWVGGG